MALPKYKLSKSNTRSRRANWKAEAPQLTVCPKCSKAKPAHIVCPYCGFYRGRFFRPRRRPKTEE